jgi:hypothetical protein
MENLVSTLMSVLKNQTNVPQIQPVSTLKAVTSVSVMLVICSTLSAKAVLLTAEIFPQSALAVHLNVTVETTCSRCGWPPTAQALAACVANQDATKDTCLLKMEHVLMLMNVALLFSTSVSSTLNVLTLTVHTLVPAIRDTKETVLLNALPINASTC